jgi:hypothetical protein
VRSIAICRPQACHPIKSVLVALLTALLASPAAASGAAPFDREHFLAAVRDAAAPGETDIDYNLFALSDANHRLIWRTEPGGRKVAVASVMTSDTFTGHYQEMTGTTPPPPLYGLEAHPMVWVTLAPELQAWCRRYARRLARAGVRNPAKLVRQRVTQRLGLPPNKRYTRVVELWVDPADVFRPCADPAVDDRRCQLQLTAAQVDGIDNYTGFFTWLYYTTYSVNAAPWTRLGYTYDWGGRSKFGASEYILQGSTPWERRSARPLSDYCQ